MKNLILKTIGFIINITAYLLPKWSTNYTFRLLCSVQRAGISERGKAFFAKGRQTYLETSGESSVLHTWGTGPKKVLFLHGWMSNSQRWLPYYEKLDMTDVTMFALDAPGHGMAKGTKLNIEVFRQAIDAAIEITGPIDTLVTHSLSNTTLAYSYLLKPSLPIKKYVVMGAPSGMDAVFTYFEDKLSLSKRAIMNLSLKINSILKMKHEEILLRNFFRNVTQPMLVIHDTKDRVTPIGPVKEAVSENSAIETMYTEGLKHDLKSEAVYKRVIDYINN